MSKLVDLSGQRFGRLLAQSYAGRRGHGSLWECVCDCGNLLKVGSYDLRSGNSKSCGCLKRERTAQLNRTHGMAGKRKTPEYRSWLAMHSRCSNPNIRAWAWYGAKGIKVCERWESFVNFFADMGARPSLVHSLDRYPNKNGNYEPGNCRWATRSEQARNRNGNHPIEGHTTIAAASEAVGIGSRVIVRRLGLGWSDRDAVTKPIRKWV